jgi:alkylation response protein AidB-like acyl-CoA dehydrogenase
MAATDVGDAAMLVQSARSVRPRILACRDALDEGRQIPADLLEALRAAGLFRLQTPREFGGYELDFVSFMEVVEEIARADGSVAWTLAVCNAGILCGTLSAAAARTLFGEAPDVLTAGSFNPRGGRAVPVPGGYRVSGRWTFVSGCRHAHWLNLGCIVYDGETARRDAQGAVVTRRVLVPTARATILDTWHVGGLRGTGSNDLLLEDVFVPEELAADLAAPPVRSGALWSFPPSSSLGLGFVAVGLGIARSAIDTLTELAGAKRPLATPVLLRERPGVPSDVARAETMLRAARMYLHGMVRAVWEDAEAGRETSMEQRALLRAAVVHAAETSARVVDLMYNAGGASSIYEACLLERCFRDVHAVTQQVMLAPQQWETAGRVLLGMGPGPIPY